jgi:hypothetical protein
MFHSLGRAKLPLRPNIWAAQQRRPTDNVEQASLHYEISGLKPKCSIMKKLISFLLLPSSFILSSSCACPHRKGESSRVMETYAGRADGLVQRETWRDAEQGGGEFLFTDPAAGQLFAVHSNQSALGGGSVFSAGTVTITVDTNTASILGATGTAGGNVIGAAAKAAAK